MWKRVYARLCIVDDSPFPNPVFFSHSFFIFIGLCRKSQTSFRSLIHLLFRSVALLSDLLRYMFIAFLFVRLDTAPFAFTLFFMSSFPVSCYCSCSRSFCDAIALFRQPSFQNLGALPFALRFFDFYAAWLITHSELLLWHFKFGVSVPVANFVMLTLMPGFCAEAQRLSKINKK